MTRMLMRILREDDGQGLIESALVAALISVVSVLRILREDDGQDLVEYAFVAALISVVSVLAMRLSAPPVNEHYKTSATTFNGS
jgi:Flp pilus assembly pilin Flp